MNLFSLQEHKKEHKETAIDITTEVNASQGEEDVS